MKEGDEPDIEVVSGIVDADSLIREAAPRGIVAVNPDIVCGRDHVISAWLRAAREFRRGSAKGDSLSTEFLRYLTGERQVSKAIELAMVEGDTAVLVSDSSLDGFIGYMGLKREKIEIKCDRRKLRALGMTDRAMEALGERAGDWILEKSALVAVL